MLKSTLTMEKIYLDYAATTPVDPRVLDSMLPYFSQIFGNPSSVHTFGQQAEAALERARELTAESLNCTPGEVIFTSCGTESDNIALRGAAIYGRRIRGANHILISPVEHHAISRTAQQLADLHNFELEYLPVDKFGIVNPQDVAARLRSTTAVVSVIYANNEIGSINPIAEIGSICRSHGAVFHTDAVQAATYLPVNVQDLSVDMLSLGGHKFYGPKGVGALYIRQGAFDTVSSNKALMAKIFPSQTGGSQEFGLRAGTQNIPYIVGFAEALNLAKHERAARRDNLLPMRDYLIGQVLEKIPNSALTGHLVNRLPNHASFVFDGLDGNSLLMMLDVEGFACSSGSACKTGDPQPSEVLTAIGLPAHQALGSLRVTLGSGSLPGHIESFLSVLPEVVDRLRLSNS
jgi:cysteine desulfurase